jgi:hypothetical protein
LNFHHTHEGAVEAAGAGITKAQGDVRNALAGFGKQMARCIETHVYNQFSVSGSSRGEMALQ